MPGISQDVLDQKTGNEGKTVFFSPAGDDNFPGTTNPQAVATLAQADTLANALNPTTADPVAIVSLARAVYAESISLNDNISINAVTINLNNDGASPVVSIGTNTRCFLDAIVNNAGPAFEIPGEVATTTTVNAISAATIGIDHNQLSGNNEVSSIFIIAGQRCVSNTSTSTLRGLKVNCDEILIGGNNGVGLYQDSTSVMDVDVDYINGSGVSGAIGIDGQSGEIFVYAKEIECDAAVNVESGATVNLLVQKLGSSDINVEAGGILNIWCTDDNYSGNITNNGTINGFISNTYYGNADTGTVDSVTGGTNIDVDNADPKNPIVNLPSNITGQQVNSVTLTAGGSASDYLDATGSYSTPPAGGQVDSVNSGTNVSVDNTDPVNPVINLPSNLAGQDVNSVTLTAGGGGSEFLANDGTYKSLSPGGSDAQVQFNDGGAFGGDSGLTYDKGTDALSVAGSVDSPEVILNGSTSGAVTLDAPATVTDYTLTYPNAGPDADDEILLWDASGDAQFVKTEYGEVVYFTEEGDLPAPSGGVITLDNTKIYRPVGTITMTNDIDLNGASIIGKSRSFDKLVSTTANQVMFTGGNSGKVKNVFIQTSGTGAKACNLSGTTGFETIVFEDCSFDGNTELGTIDNNFATQLQDCVFQNNAAGLVINDVQKFSHNDSAWIQNNTATTNLTFTGAFDLIKMTSGGMGVANTLTGMSVAGITSLASFGQIDGGFAFSGAGTYVDDETVFEDVEWEVEALGVAQTYKDREAFGNVRKDGSTTTTITSSGVPVKVTGASTLGLNFRMDDDSSTDNRVRYLGKLGKSVTISGSISIDNFSGGDDNVSVYVAKNGAVITGSRVQFQVGGFLDTQASGFNETVFMETNDYLEVWVANDDDTTNLVVRTYNFTAK